MAESEKKKNWLSELFVAPYILAKVYSACVLTACCQMLLVFSLWFFRFAMCTKPNGWPLENAKAFMRKTHLKREKYQQPLEVIERATL